MISTATHPPPSRVIHPSLRTVILLLPPRQRQAPLRRPLVSAVRAGQSIIMPVKRVWFAYTAQQGAKSAENVTRLNTEPASSRTVLHRVDRLALPQNLPPPIFHMVLS